MLGPAPSQNFMSIAAHLKLFMIWDTHTDLAECCDNDTACVRPRKSEHEGRCDTIECARLDEDPENGKAGCTNRLRGTPNRLPKPISDQQCCSELCRNREAPR